MGRKPVIAIEHLEDNVGIWLFLEYRHSCLLAGCNNIVITNLPRKYHSLFKKYCCKTEESSVLELFPQDKILILDPQADRLLTKKDLETVDVVVIGGILGDHPPRGRTKKLLSSRAPHAIKRSLGGGQYSIDGAVFVVTRVIGSAEIHEIPFVDGVILRDNTGGIVREIMLPFRYPIIGGEPLLAPGLREYLLYGSLPEYIRKELSKDIVEDKQH